MNVIRGVMTGGLDGAKLDGLAQALDDQASASAKDEQAPLALDDGILKEFPGVELPIRAYDWFKRRLNQEASKGTLRLLVGSCRYPSQFIDDDMGDAVFSGMQKHVGSQGEGEVRLEGADLLLLLGDQIYADATAGLFDAENWRERYMERYRKAFSSKSLAELARSLPVHFAIDDHEHDDQWSGVPGGSSPEHDLERQRKGDAFRTARHYQAPARGDEPLWYATDHPAETGLPLFMTDARSEREFRDRSNLNEAHMLGAPQRAAVNTWLGRVSKEPGFKFIASSVAIVPLHRRLFDASDVCDLRSGKSWNEDGWAGYPATLAWVVHEIVRQKIRNVVFVGGDLHLNLAACLTLHSDGHDDVRAVQVVASGLYNPLPLTGMTPDEPQHSGRIVVADGIWIEFAVHLPQQSMQQSMQQFVRIDADAEGLEVRFCNHDGGSAQPWCVKAE